MEKIVYSVNDINKYIKHILVNDESLKYIFVKGEISNYKIASTGHIYFSLKDNDSLINAVMFSNYASKLIFTPKNGDEVIVLASIDAYVPRGTYQLFVYEMNLKGKGSQLEELEKLKKKLALEGLFDQSKKRKINIYPQNIGLITAKNGAAIKDLTFNINRRFPLCNIYFFPSSVQGDNASKELLKAFKLSQNYPLDTLIIGRGGGSNEDLSAFNDEELVRNIANSKFPVISAVGHEIDSTLVDYVADVRASTPTAAAELATVDIREILQKIFLLKEDMSTLLREKVSDIKDQVNNYKDDLNYLLDNIVTNLKDKINFYKKQLNALNPNSILSRGYSLTLDKNGKAITDINNVNLNDEIVTIVKNGKLVSNIKEKFYE